MFLVIILRTVYHRDFTFHMLIGLAKGLNPIYFMFLTSKVKVTRVTFVKKGFPLIFVRTIFHRSFVIDVLIGLNKDKTTFDFEFTRSKVKI